MVQKPRHPPWRDVVPVSPFSFRHWRGVSSRRGVEKREKEKRERKEERRNLSLPAASSPLPTLCLVPRIITHPRSSPILERWHIVTHRIARELQKSSPFQAETRDTFCTFLFFSCFSVFPFFSLFFFFYYSLRRNACDILFTGRVASRRKRAVVKMH